MFCPGCRKEMTRAGHFWVCGDHPSPVVLPVEVVTLPSGITPAGLPTPIALTVAEFFKEPNPFIALHRMTDAAELITRFLATIILSDIHHQLGDFPSALKKQLAGTLAHPTFGVWREILSSGLKLLNGHGKSCFVEELSQFWLECWKQLIGRNDGDAGREIIALRNDLAHAGRLTDDAAMTLLASHTKPFNDALLRLDFLENYLQIATLRGDDLPLMLRGLPQSSDWSLPHLAERQGRGLPALEPERVYLLKEGAALDLFPLHGYDVVKLWREEEQQFHEVDRPAPLLYVRYNERRKILEFTAFAQNSYFAQRSVPFHESFLKIFNLSAWRRQKEAEESRRSEWRRERYDFRDIIVELSEGLVGRTAGRDNQMGGAGHAQPSQIDQVKRWLRGRCQTGGVLWISGKPGVGKSAFIAELAKRLDGDPGYCVIPFFFRSGDARCSPSHFYNAASLRLSESFGLQLQEDVRESRQACFEKVFEAAREKQSLASSAPAIVFLLDGLDEIVKQHSDFLHYLLSLRRRQTIWVCAGRGDSSLAEIFTPENSERIWEDGELPPLTERDVRALIEHECGGLRYALFERDEQSAGGGYHNRFTERLVKKSEGLPLYVRLVIEDIKSGRLTFRDEGLLPEGLRDYFERILERLGVGDIPQLLTDVLSLLCWSREPLTEEIIRESLRPLYGRPESWEMALSSALRYGHVMMRRAHTREGLPGWTLYHESFREHLRMTSTIKVARERAHGLLLGWCSEWKTHGNPYALRRYAEHLVGAGRYDDLYALANDESYVKAQLAGIAAEPDAPLRTVQSALQAAASRDDAARMAEFLLLHAQRLQEIKQESPIEAFRAGKTEKALKLADLYNPEDRTLWYLLLACELIEGGQEEEAEQTLKRLQEQDVPRFTSSPKGTYCAYLLAQLAVTPEASFFQLADRLFDEVSLATLGEFLVEMGRADHAMRVVHSIRDEMQRAFALSEMAVLLAKASEKARAGDCITHVLQSLSRVDNEYCRAISLSKLAIAQYRMGGEPVLLATHLEAAFQSTDSINDTRVQDDALRCLAKAFALTGNFSSAFSECRKIKVHWIRAAALGEIGAALFGFDEDEAAQDCFGMAIDTALEITFAPNRDWALRDIARSLADANAPDVVVALVEKIESGDDRVSALCAAARSYFRVGDSGASNDMLEKAVEIADKLERGDERFRALYTVGSAFLEVGERALIRDFLGATVEMTQTDRDRKSLAESLFLIAQVLFETGHVKTARKCLESVGVLTILHNADGENDHLLSTLAMRLAQDNNYSSALSVATCVNSSWRRDEAIGSVIKQQAENQAFSSALRTVQSIDDSFLYNEGDRAAAFLAFAKALIQSGQVNAARDSLNLAFQGAKTLTKKHTRAHLLRNVAITFAQIGDFAAANQIAKNLDDPAHRIDILLAIANAPEVINNRDITRGCVNLALQAAKEIDSPSERSLYLDNLSRAFIQLKDKNMALECLALSIIEALKVPDSLGYSDALHSRVETLVRTFGFPISYRIAGTFVDASHRAHILNALADVSIRSGETDNAQLCTDACLQCLDLIDDHPDRSGILLSLSEKLAGIGRFSLAIQMAEAVGDFLLRAYALMQISGSLIKAGEIPWAYQVALKIRWVDKKDEALDHVAIAFAKAGDCAGAITAAQEISNFQKRERVLNSVGREKSAEPDELELLTSVERFSPDKYNRLFQAASKYVEAGEKDNFKRLLVLCAWNISSAYQMCSLLSKLYPTQALEVLKIVHPNSYAG